MVLSPASCFLGPQCFLATGIHNRPSLRAMPTMACSRRPNWRYARYADEKQMDKLSRTLMLYSMLVSESIHWGEFHRAHWSVHNWSCWSGIKFRAFTLATQSTGVKLNLLPSMSGKHRSFSTSGSCIELPPSPSCCIVVIVEAATSERKWKNTSSADAPVIELPPKGKWQLLGGLWWLAISTIISTIITTIPIWSLGSDRWDQDDVRMPANPVVLPVATLPHHRPVSSIFFGMESNFKWFNTSCSVLIVGSILRTRLLSWIRIAESSL